MPADRDRLERVREAKRKREFDDAMRDLDALAEGTTTRKEGDAMRSSTPPRTSYGRPGKGLPSRKWWAATVVAAGTIGTDWAVTGHWSQTLTIAAVGLAVQRATAYLVPNGGET